ncbi:MAG: desulfoferrodoxin family protein [Thermoplasmata archaeon]|nr:desulfoferrodoxin family protein [Thermoplasmata archaeon]
MTQKYVCQKCGTVVELLYKGGCTPSCCGEPMALCEVKTEDAAKEKHVPYITREGGEVKVVVGKDNPHPMTEEHYIVYIELCADGVLMRKYLKPGDAPEAVFRTDAKELAAGELCNKHGVWKSNQ